MEIAGLLKHSEAATVTPEGLTIAEKKALEKMNLEEVCISNVIALLLLLLIIVLG